MEITIPAGRRLGDTVIEVDHLSKGFGDRLLIEDLSFSLPRAGIVGDHRPERRRQDHPVQDAHRAGASRRGTVTIGDTVELAYVDQSRDTLDADATVYEEITGGVEHMKVGNREIHGRAYCASFNFKGTDQQKRVGDLSGGERNRVHLAKILKSGGNVLLLDEPTNDLDVDTLRALEDGARELPRLRRGDQPRSLVPRPHRHARARVRRRQPGALVRGQLHASTRRGATRSSASAPTNRTASSTSRSRDAGRTDDGHATDHQGVHRRLRVRHRRHDHLLGRRQQQRRRADDRRLHRRRRDRADDGQHRDGARTDRRVRRCVDEPSTLEAQVRPARRQGADESRRALVGARCALGARRLTTAAPDDRRERRAAGGPVGHRGRAPLVDVRDEMAQAGAPPWQVMDDGDAASHRFLAGALAEQRPDDAVLSEEGLDDPRRFDADRVWIVDPLDGTSEFGEDGRADWAVHVALWERGSLRCRRRQHSRRSTSSSAPTRRRPAAA